MSAPENVDVAKVLGPAPLCLVCAASFAETPEGLCAACQHDMDEGCAPITDADVEELRDFYGEDAA